MSMTREPKCVSSYGEWAKIGENLQFIKISWKFTKHFVKIIFIREIDLQIYVKLYFFFNFITHYARPSKRHRQPHPSCLGWLTRFNCYQPKYCCVIKSHWYWFLVKIQKKLAMMSSSSASLRTWSWTTDLSKKLISREDF